MSDKLPPILELIIKERLAQMSDAELEYFLENNKISMGKFTTHDKYAWTEKVARQGRKQL